MPASASDLHKDVKMGGELEKIAEKELRLKGSWQTMFLFLLGLVISCNYFCAIIPYLYNTSFFIRVIKLLNVCFSKLSQVQSKTIMWLVLLGILSKSRQNHFICIY